MAGSDQDPVMLQAAAKPVGLAVQEPCDTNQNTSKTVRHS